MKKTIFFLTLCLFTINLYSQAPAKSKDYYLQKSKNGKTTAWILLGGGIALMGAGVAIQAKSLNDGWDWDGNTVTLLDATGSVVALAGFAVSLVSIGFFTRAHRFKKRAAEISFQRQPIQFLYSADLVTKAQQAIVVRIAL